MIKKIWNWFWFRHGKVRYHFWLDGDRYIVSASNGDKTVYDCYGYTLESAKATALFKLQQQISKKTNRELINNGNEFKIVSH